MAAWPDYWPFPIRIKLLLNRLYSQRLQEAKNVKVIMATGDGLTTARAGRSKLGIEGSAW